MTSRENACAGLLLRTTIALVALAALALASAALAADPKPDAIIKNKNIEARVFLDDKIKADAALAADCLDDGKKWLDKFNKLDQPYYPKLEIQPEKKP